jgi:hypothetical protein
VYRIASSIDDDLLLVPAAGGEPTLLTRHNGAVRHLPGPWTPDGTGFWLLTDADREYLALLWHGLAGAASVVDEPAWDVDEGHGFTKRENELRARADVVDFLVEHLTRATVPT